jgi:hypothetical protein
MEASQTGVVFGNKSLVQGLDETIVLSIVNDPDPCSCWDDYAERYIFLGAIEEAQDKERVVKVIVMEVDCSEDDEEAMWKVMFAGFAEADEEIEAWRECQKGGDNSLCLGK